MQPAQRQKKFHEMLENFDQAMLCTSTPDGQLRARPMAIAKVDGEADLLFATHAQSGKVEEIAQDNDVSVVMQGDRQYLSLSGTARIENDRSLIQDLEDPYWRVWFKDGADDPDVRLIRVKAEQGEYWDMSGTEGLKYLWEAGKAFVSGEPIQQDPKDVNAKTPL